MSQWLPFVWCVLKRKKRATFFVSTDFFPIFPVSFRYKTSLGVFFFIFCKNFNWNSSGLWAQLERFVTTSSAFAYVFFFMHCHKITGNEKWEITRDWFFLRLDKHFFFLCVSHTMKCMWALMNAVQITYLVFRS